MNLQASAPFEPSVSAQHSNAPQLLSKVHIILSHTSHPGNIGAAARAMKTMGLSQLVLVNPKKFPDPEAHARAAGADDILERAIICSSLDEALAGSIFTLAVSARQRNLGPETCSAREAAPLLLNYVQAEKTASVALLFGNESAGLSNAEVQRCQRTAFIPANPDYSSLNLGSAVQLLCYELRLAALAEQPPMHTKALALSSPLAKHDDVERFYAHLEKIMVSTQFLDPQQPKRLLPKLRRLFGRSQLERDEINILRGILDAVEKKI